MRIAATTFALVACFVVRLLAAEVGPTTRDNAAPNSFYQRVVRRGAELRPGAVEPGKVGDRPVVYVARFDAAGRRLATSTRSEVHVWNVPSMEAAQKPIALQQPVEAADLSPDGESLLTVDGNGQLFVRRVGADDPMWGRRHVTGFEWAAFSPDGRSVLLIERGDKTVRLLDAVSGRETLAVHDATSEHGIEAAISRDGTRIMTSSLGLTRVWSATTGNLVSTAPRFGAVFAISPKGNRLAGQTDAGEISTFDATSGKSLITIKAEIRGDSQVANICALAFSPDGRFVAISKEELGVQVWDATTGQAASRRLPLPPNRDDTPFSSILFTPDGKRMILSNEYGASVWDVSTGTRLVTMANTIHGWPAPVGTAVSPDGQYIAVNFGGPVELWKRTP